jgi:hypothetical protein
VIELGDREIATELERVCLIVGDVNAAVGSNKDLEGVLGVDPNRVIVAMRTPAPLCERLAAVGAHADVEVGFINPIVILRVNQD